MPDRVPETYGLRPICLRRVVVDTVPGEEPEAPLAVQTWEKPAVSVGEVIAALPELRRRASGREAGTRTAVMTLVMVIGPDDDPEVAAAPVRSLGAHHPCRAVVLRPELDSTPVIDAKAYLWRAEPAASAGHPVFFEELHLRVGGQAASHLASIVGPFVLADLPVVMWFPGELPDPTDPLLKLATAVVVDTRVVPPGAWRYRPLLPHAARTRQPQPVVDLSWVRLQPWRELLAGLFEPEHSRRFPAGRPLGVRPAASPAHVTYWAAGSWPSSTFAPGSSC